MRMEEAGAARWKHWGRALVWLACGVSWFAAFGIDIPLIRGYFRPSGFRLAADLACFRDNGAYLGRHVLTAAQSAAEICTYKYPPPFLFLATPLSWFKPEADFVLWSMVSAISLVCAARMLGLSWRAVFLGIAAPPTMLCLSIGESGIIVSALLLVALGWADVAPVAAGIAAGAMIVKPQLGLLLPVCYIASRNWRAFLTAAVTAGFLCVLAGVVFGHSVWLYYLHEGIEATHDTLAAPWPQLDQHIMVTPYIFMHSLGARFSLASAAQFVATILASLAVWKLWRNPSTPSRLPMTLCLAALATPFACLYDLSALVLILAVQGGMPFVWFWIFSGFYLFVSVFSVAPAALGLALLLWMLWRERGESEHRGAYPLSNGFA